MKVPQYKDSTVVQKGLSTPFQSFSTSSAEFGGAEGRALEGFGGQAAKLAKTMELMQDEDDATAARGYFTEYQAGESEADWGENGYYSQRGEVAYKGLTGALKAKQERKKLFVQKAQNANQQNILSKVIDARINADTESMSRHAYKERTTWQLGIESATVESNLNNAVANAGNPERIALERNSANASIERIVGMKGGGAEEVALAKEKWSSDFHKLTVHRMMVHDPAGAKEYYKENKKSILGTERAVLEEKLKGVVNLAQAQASTDKIIVDNPEDLTAQRKVAAKIKDPDVRKLTESLITTKFSEREQERALHERTINRGSWRDLEALKTQGGNSDQMLAVVSQVDDPTVRHNMMTWVQKEVSGAGIVTDQATKYQLLDMVTDSPDEFKNLDITKYYHVLSKTDRDKLETAQDKVRADKKLPHERTTKQLTDDALKAMGIDTTPKEGSKDAKRIYKFRNALEDELEIIRIENDGKPVSYDDKKKAIDRLLIKGEVRGTLWDTDKFAFEVKPGEEFYVDDVSDIPIAEARKIREALKGVGMSTTDQDVVNLFNLKRSK